MVKQISCPFCAGVDKENIPINCLICRNSPKYLDQRKEYYERIDGNV